MRSGSMSASNGAVDTPTAASTPGIRTPRHRDLRVQARQPQHLGPGRLRQLVNDARGDDAGYLICHSTLPYSGSTNPPAICRGFADRYRTWQLQVIERLRGFIEVPALTPPTGPTDPPGAAADGTPESRTPPPDGPHVAQPVTRAARHAA
jgi:hypothetical protein